MTSSPLWCHDHTPMTSAKIFEIWLTGHMTFCCTLIGPFVPRDLYPAFWLVCTVVAPFTTIAKQKIIMIALYLWLGRTKRLLCFIAGWIYDINHSSFTTQNLKGLHKDRESHGHRLIRKGGIFFLFFWCFLLLYISLNTFIHPYISLQYKTPAIFPWLNLEERKQKR